MFSSPTFKKIGALLIVGLRLRIDGPDELPALWERFGRYFGNIPGQVGAEAYGVMYNVTNTARGYQFDYLAGVAASSLEKVPRELNHLDIPAQSYATFTHEGPASQLSHTIAAIWQNWQEPWGRPSSGLVRTIEHYGEAFDPQTATGDIEVWIPLAH